MKIIHTTKDIPWMSIPNEANIISPDGFAPPDDLITSCFVLVFHNDQVLFSHIKKNSRAWDIPGGHREEGETAEQTALREVYEETYVKTKILDIVAYQQLKMLGKKPAEYKYPYPESFQVFYLGEVVTVEEFVENEEVKERGFFEIKDLNKVDWLSPEREANSVIFNLAYNIYRSK